MTENAEHASPVPSESEHELDRALDAASPVASIPRRRLRVPSPARLLPGFLRRRLGDSAQLVAAALLVVVVAGLGFGGWTAAKHFNLFGAQPVKRFQAAVVSFQVYSTLPANGDTGVTNGDQITIEFTRAVVPASLNGDFFVSPQVNGTFKAGAYPTQVVFTPSKPFADGTIVKVMIHGEFQSKEGAQLGADYSFSFTMAPADNGVSFQNNYFQYAVDTEPVGSTQTYTMQVGHSVDPNGTVTVYKSTMQSLLENIVYTNQLDSYGFPSSGYTTSLVDTNAMTSVQVVHGLTDGASFKVAEGEGVYAIVASSHGAQAGHFWLVISSFGVVARQDDQQTVFYAHDFADATSPSIAVTAYNLEDSVKTLAQATMAGSGSMTTSYSPATDAFVAQTKDGRQAFIPMAGYLSMADIRVQKDLSRTNMIYGLTDKPTYAVGDTLRYSAFVRTDNDALYQLPTSGLQLSLYVAENPYATHLADFGVNTTSAGMISGSLAIPASFASKSGPHSLLLYAKAAAGGTDQPIAAFTVVKSTSSSGRVIVSFAKSDYLAKDTIVAMVSATDANGQPRAGASLSASIYTKNYYENDVQANQTSLDTIGSAINDTPLTVHLDANGRGTVPIDVSQFPDSGSQVVTVQASFGTGDAAVAGGASAIVHQADGVITFASSRTIIAPGGTLEARMYVRDFNGKPLAGTPVSYKITATTTSGSSSTDKQIASGSVIADSNGYAEISLPVAKSYTSATTFKLDVTGVDASNEAFTASNYYYISSPSGTTAFSDVLLAGLDVFGAPPVVTVGQTLHLTVNAPRAIDALVTLERGRIYKSEVVHLNQGDNGYDVTITPQLAPSFNLVFSYISNGNYAAEGTSYTISPTTQAAFVQLTTDKSAYSANDTALVSVDAQDATGTSLVTNVILGVVDARLYDLSNQVTPAMLPFLYAPRESTTNGSSSLTIMGSGGGKCGGGGPDQPSLSGPTGTTLLWLPGMLTGSNGTATTSIKLPKGTWRIYAYTMSADTIVGSAETTVTAN